MAHLLLGPRLDTLSRSRCSMQGGTPLDSMNNNRWSKSAIENQGAVECTDAINGFPPFDRTSAPPASPGEEDRGLPLLPRDFYLAQQGALHTGDPAAALRVAEESSIGSEAYGSSELPTHGLEKRSLDAGASSNTPLLASHPGGQPAMYYPGPTYEDLTEAEQAEEDIDAAEQVQAGNIIADVDSITDAGYESDTATAASTSLASSVWDYSFENGRRYHKFREGRYNFPNDDVEQQREDMKHAMVKMLTQKLHFAPIGDNPQQILDIGTGTGIYAIEMGDTYPSATVLGIDLSPIQPDWVPPNVKFMVDDVESPWLHPRNHFDYIHSRHTVMAIKDWDRLLRRAYEHLRPGGWIELQEIHHYPKSSNNTMAPNHPVAVYWRLINEGLNALGINFKFTSEGRIAEVLRQAGYVNVTEQVFHVPIGTWPKNKKLKNVGLYWKTILLDGAQAIALGPMTRGLRWRREQVETFLATVRKAYHDNSCLMYMPFVCVYGQKPESLY
ncbi:S-adenosyl-L-methionine-dependent methyltransferase [Xylariaceae sp. FL0016]|nr:S-adenosyl-L-methionine-dependent methyltransferase [Xylariaceae sp. FL0016]